MNKLATLVLFAPLLPFAPLSAQRPADAPDTLPAGTPPNTVFIDEMTWAEVRDFVASRDASVIIGTAGTEQKGPHMVDGEHKFVLEYAADQIARAFGNTLVAPIITYVPEGSWDPPRGHMGKPGTITLPQDRFVELLVNAGQSLKSGGFKNIFFIGESGGNGTGMRLAAERLEEAWAGEARAFWINDYYTKGHSDQNAYVTETFGIPRNEIGGHANILDTSEMLFVNPNHVRPDKIVDGGGYPNSGVSGDPTMATAALGRIFLQFKIDNALAQMRGLVDGTIEPTVAGQRGGRGGGRGGQGGRRGRGRGGQRGAVAEATATVPAAPQPTYLTAPEGISPNNPPDTVFIEELTWEETRDAIRDGKRTVIIPTGGTEKNGYHMILGKHNFIVKYCADLMARRIGNTLVAPTVKYVPEGNPERGRPGVISNPSPAYDQLLDAAARSLAAHGFNEILFIGDSGGNQSGMTNVANALNEEWGENGPKAYAITDYYSQGRVHYRAYMLAEYGYTDRDVGGHAGISDTSQLLFVYPDGIRKDQIMPWGGANDSGVSGDPMKASAEIGKMGIEFKVNAGIAQYQQLKNPGGQRGRGGRGRGRGRRGRRGGG